MSEQTSEFSSDAKPEQEETQNEKIDKSFNAALTARRNDRDEIIYKADEGYCKLDQGHGWQDYSHNSTEQEYNLAKDDIRAALSAFVYELRDRDIIK